MEKIVPPPRLARNVAFGKRCSPPLNLFWSVKQTKQKVVQAITNLLYCLWACRIAGPIRCSCLAKMHVPFEEAFCLCATCLSFPLPFLEWHSSLFISLCWHFLAILPTHVFSMGKFEISHLPLPPPPPDLWTTAYLSRDTETPAGKMKDSS